MEFSTMLIVVGVFHLVILSIFLYLVYRYHFVQVKQEILAVTDTCGILSKDLKNYAIIADSQQKNLKGLTELVELQQQNLSTISETTRNQQQQLTELIDNAAQQQKNLDSMEKRIVEVENVGNLYKSLLDELPVAIGKYKTAMKIRKTEAQRQCETANAQDDLELKQFLEREMEGIETRNKLIEELPEMFAKFQEIMEPINARLKLFSDTDKYGTGSILSYSAKRAKTILASIGSQSAAEKLPLLRENGQHEVPEPVDE